MKLSTRTTYGLRAMVILARYYQKEKISLTKIAKDEGISSKYLEKLFSQLKKNKLIISEKGSQGGYALSRNPAKITVYEIMEALEGSLAPFYCVTQTKNNKCIKSHKCPALKVLLELDKATKGVLLKIKLIDLL